MSVTLALLSSWPKSVIGRIRVRLGYLSFRIQLEGDVRGGGRGSTECLGKSSCSEVTPADERRRHSPGCAEGSSACETHQQGQQYDADQAGDEDDPTRTGSQNDLALSCLLRRKHGSIVLVVLMPIIAHDSPIACRCRTITTALRVKFRML